MTRSLVELMVGAGSFMIALQLLCISLLVESYGAFWATLGLGFLIFCLYWCFEDVLFPKSGKRG